MVTSVDKVNLLLTAEQDTTAFPQLISTIRPQMFFLICTPKSQVQLTDCLKMQN